MSAEAAPSHGRLSTESHLTSPKSLSQSLSLSLCLVAASLRASVPDLSGEWHLARRRLLNGRGHRGRKEREKRDLGHGFTSPSFPASLPPTHFSQATFSVGPAGQSVVPLSAGPPVFVSHPRAAGNQLSDATARWELEKPPAMPPHAFMPNNSHVNLIHQWIMSTIIR